MAAAWVVFCVVCVSLLNFVPSVGCVPCMEIARCETRNAMCGVEASETCQNTHTCSHIDRA